MSLVSSQIADTSTAVAEDKYADLSPQQSAFEQKVDALLTPAAEAKAKEILATVEPTVVKIDANIAAAMHRHHNKHNRNLQIRKAQDYADAMVRGEWRRNHQGMASYDDGSLADGQHRSAAIVLSGKPQEFLISRIQEDAAPTIDLSKGRTAGDALQLDGIDEPHLKSRIARDVMTYTAEAEYGSKPRLSVLLVKNWVIEHNDLLDTSVQIGRRSDENVSEPCMSQSEAGTIAMLMLLGGYTENDVVGFICSVQQGVASYPECPTVELGRKFVAAKNAQASKKKLTKKQRLALAGKSAALWKSGRSVRSLAWNPKKETLPKFEPPVDEA